MTILADMVTELQQRVLSSMREETNQLGTSIPANASSIALGPGRQLGSIQANSILQIDWELFFVLGTNSTSSIAVVPGYYGSQSVPHTAGALINVNPRFPAVDIIRAINQDLYDLSSPTNGLFQPKELTLIFNPVVVGYDATDALTGVQAISEQWIDILEVRCQEFGPERRWPMIPRSKVRLERNANPVLFPSGMSVKVYYPAYPGQQIRISYKARYDGPLQNPNDDVEKVTGLHADAHDIPPLGAMCRLMEVRDIKRSFTEDQPQPRTATEVPVGAALTSMRQVLAHRQQRIDAERIALQASWAVQKR
jgi:hypothetical protein